MKFLGPAAFAAMMLAATSSMAAEHLTAPTMNVLINNETPYPVYTVTDGGGRNCLEGGLAAQTIQPKTYRIEFMLTLPRSCDSGTVSQAIAISAPVQQELRVDLPITFSRSGQTGAPQATLGIFTVFTEYLDGTLALRVMCAKPEACTYYQPTLTVVNQTGRALALTPQDNGCFGNPPPAPFTAALGDRKTVQFTTCQQLVFKVAQGASPEGDVWIFNFENGSLAPDVRSGIFNAAVQSQGQQVTVTVACNPRAVQAEMCF